MILNDLSNCFYPYPKGGKDSFNSKSKMPCKYKMKSNNVVTDFCIMTKSTRYGIKRTKKYNERHEVFFGRAYRNKCIKDGLIVFLTEEDHRGKNGVHGKDGDKFNRYLKKKAQIAWMDYYKKTNEDFIKRYGKSYL